MPMARPLPGLNDVRIASVTRPFASNAASGKGMPSARYAAMNAESMHPVPWTSA